MKLNFICNVVDGGWSSTDKRLGGTEDSIVKWAEDLVRRGHEVSVFHNARDDEYALYNGVHYMPRELYIGGGDFCINVKSSDIDPKEPSIYFTNEVDANEKDLSKYMAVVWPSNWAKDNIEVNNPFVYVVPHGYDPKQIYPGEKVNKRCLYASSPDRGLETLARIWPAVVDHDPDAELFVTYGGHIYTPNTTCGDFTEEEMNSLYRTSDLWLHPCNGGELFGITAVKAQAAGAIPVYFPTMALTEIVKHGVVCIDDYTMYEAIIDLLNNQAEKDRLRQLLVEEKYTTWKQSTTQLLRVIHEMREIAI